MPTESQEVGSNGFEGTTGWAPFGRLGSRTLKTRTKVCIVVVGSGYLQAGGAREDQHHVVPRMLEKQNSTLR